MKLEMKLKDWGGNNVPTSPTYSIYALVLCIFAKIPRFAWNFRYAQLLAAMPNKINKDKEILLELLRQASENARMYINLRAKHFATFLVLNSILGFAISQIESLKIARSYLSVLGLLLTLLFWQLDFRTSQYYQSEKTRILNYEKMLNAPTLSYPPRRIFLRASTITNLIFLLIIIFWVFILIKK